MAETTYLVTCEGQYYTGDKSRKGFGKYTVTLELGEKEKKQGFLSVIKREVLERATAMQKLYPDWVRYRTHVITNAVNKDKGAPVKDLSLMNRSQIVAYINKQGWPIHPELYPEVTDLRQALKDYRNDKEQFAKTQADKEFKYGDRLKISQSVLERNPWLTKEGVTPDVPANHNPEPPVVNADPGIDAFDAEDEFEALVGGV